MARIQYPAVVSIRLTAAQRDTVREDAAKAAMNLSRYGRHRLLGHPVRAFTDAATLRELRRIGGLIRHAYDDITDCDEPAAKRAAQRDARTALEALAAAAERLGRQPNQP